ncbi:hypothetical protein [Coleofasciculus sp. FACHB-SPT36]|uniref:hypothetical protein n=1 Tax=Cyanophyceae TaxID=3028117 RepID=UPI00168BEA8A|nr:hypothetical protein [Coleofasciculus sp. FACHB-SPT36]MBD2538012.1 hypothetical protein [Coleofasciculus sp. FACHB-SPT36]
MWLTRTDESTTHSSFILPKYQSTPPVLLVTSLLSSSGGATGMLEADKGWVMALALEASIPF